MEPTLDPQRLLAAIELGTNSFKLLLARPHHHITVFVRRKYPVLIGRDRAADGSISGDSQNRAVAALRSFSLALRAHRVSEIRAVATAAVRDAPNRAELVSRARDELGFEIEVISGEEEASLIYNGVLRFLPFHHESVLLAVDIGGGFTEFVVGQKGKVLFAASLNLGHISLTESFVERGKLEGLQSHIRSVLGQSEVVEKVRELGFDVAVGSSGTIRSIEKSVSFGKSGRGWGFRREELRLLVDKLCAFSPGETEGVMRLGFSKRRGEFIVTGAVLLLEIFDALAIDEMRVSGYALSEGVISEMMEKHCSGYETNQNVRWSSVVGLAARFCGEDRMESSVRCVGIAKEIFDGIWRHFELSECNRRVIKKVLTK